MTATMTRYGRRMTGSGAPDKHDNQAASVLVSVPHRRKHQTSRRPARRDSRRETEVR